MPFFLENTDITKIKADAIVNAANSSLLGGGGVDGAIHRAAGPDLLAECRTLGPCPTGKAVITGGYRLPAKYVIHTVGPVWQGGSAGEEQLLASCYRESLALAQSRGLTSLAFPLISAGAYGYPPAEAFSVAVREIRHFLEKQEMTVILVLFGNPPVFPRNQFSEIRQYLAENSSFPENGAAARDAEEAAAPAKDTGERRAPDKEKQAKVLPRRIGIVRKMRKNHKEESLFSDFSGAEGSLNHAFGGKADALPIPENELSPDVAAANVCAESVCAPDRPSPFEKSPAVPVAVNGDYPKEKVRETVLRPEEAPLSQAAGTASAKNPVSSDLAPKGSLADAVKNLEDGFTPTLFRMMDDKGISDVECYKRANLDKKLFSKIRSNPEYHPKKSTVLAFCLALELNRQDSEELLRSAGYAFSGSSLSDVIVLYFIQNGRYDIYEVNQALWQYDMPLLGAAVRE